MILDYFSRKDLNLLFKGFNVSPLFYNFLIDSVKELNIEKKNLEKFTKFEIHHTAKRVSLIKIYKLWTSLEKTTHYSDLGIKIADTFLPSKAGVIGELFMNSENLKESINIMRRFLPIMINNIFVEYEEYEDKFILYFDMVPRFLIPFSAVECYIKIGYNWIKEYTGLKEIPVLEINYIFKKPKHYIYYKNNFKSTNIFFNQKRNYVILKKDIFYIKNKNKKITPYSKIVEYAEKINTDLDKKSSFTQKIINQILFTMPEGKNSINNIAEILNISSTTLKRKLKTENTTFTQLTELIRKKLAYSLMKDSRYSFEEISYLLGYSEYSPFFRAFKKWFKLTPSEFRIKYAK